MSLVLCVLSLFVLLQPTAKAQNVVNPPILPQIGGMSSVSSTCYKIDESGVADCVQVQVGNKYTCPGKNRFAPKCQDNKTTYFKSTGEVFTKPVVDTNFYGQYPGSGWITARYNGNAYGCQNLQTVGSGGHVEPTPIRGCGRLITWDEYNVLPRNSDGLLVSHNLWPAPWLEPHFTSGFQLWSNDRNEVTDVSNYGFVVSDVQVGNFAYWMHAPLLCTDTCTEIQLPNLAINNFGDYVGGTVANINQVQYDLSLSYMVSANDINDAGFIAGQCSSLTALTGCIIKVD
jgi:hypothetical protein